MSESAEPRVQSLWQTWREDLRAHRGDWTLPGFRAVAVCRFGQWRMTIRFKPLRAPLSVLYRWMYRRCRNGYGIELPYSVQLGRRVVVEHQGAIVVHGNAIIGDDCVLRQGVTLGNRYLERPFEAPILGRRVNVGAGAKVLGRVTIGDDAVIGANSVVLHDVPPGTTVVGIPARPVASQQPPDAPASAHVTASHAAAATLAPRDDDRSSPAHSRH
jgi:serine O-acetyltransferase